MKNSASDRQKGADTIKKAMARPQYAVCTSEDTQHATLSRGDWDGSEQAFTDTILYDTLTFTPSQMCLHLVNLTMVFFYDFAHCFFKTVCVW